MNLLPRCNFEEEECRKYEHEKEYAVVDRSLLSIISAVIRNFPGLVKSVRPYRSFRRQNRAAKRGVGPVRFQCRFVLHAERREKNSVAAVKIDRNGKCNFVRNRLVAAERRGR